VNGLPAPQGSKRHVGNGRMVESSKAVGPWREAVRAEAQKVLARLPVPRKFEGRIYWDGAAASVTAVFLLPRPQGHYGTGRNSGTIRPSAPPFPAGRPDLDKLLRSTLDGLTEAGVWRDDAQVASIYAAKQYARPGVACGVIIEVDGLKEENGDQSH
jgi:crossover junction endodeoxyribonuclease RusA